MQQCEELYSTGYSALTMERVADRAGTSRAVIYRRWRNRAELGDLLADEEAYDCIQSQLLTSGAEFILICPFSW
jgi:AcrR family transcriptional regulator